MDGKELVSVRLEKDVLDDVDQFAEQNDISRSDAIRRFVQRGREYDRLDERLTRIERRLDRPLWKRLL